MRLRSSIGRELVRAGWSLARHRRHYVLVSPDGFRIVISGSGSDWRGRRNTAARLAKMWREGCDHVPAKYQKGTRQS